MRLADVLIGLLLVTGALASCFKMQISALKTVRAAYEQTHRYAEAAHGLADEIRAGRCAAEAADGRDRTLICSTHQSSESEFTDEILILAP